MLRATVFFVVVLFTLSHGAPAESEWDWRIIGGSDAPPGSADYQVSINTLINTHICGGAILNARTIVTAGQCMRGRTPTTIIVVVGTYTLSTGGTGYAVSKITAHPSYDHINRLNDIALVITRNPIVLGGNVQAIPLSTEITPGGVTATFTGWGYISYPDPEILPNNLQIIKLKTIEFAQCKSDLANFAPVYETNVCTFTTLGKGICKEDGGDPLVAGGRLVGIVSWGVLCAKGFPDVYTRISSFVPWINANSES